MYKGRIIADYDAINFSDRGHQSLFIGAIQAFLQAPDRDPKLKAAIQAYTLKGDFPDDVRSIIEKYHITPTWDEGWREIFHVLDFTGTSESGFKIADMQSGLTFRKITPGDKVDVFKMSGTEVEVTFDDYGGALGWHHSWFTDKKWWQIEDTTMEFQSKAYSSRAQAYYDLLDAVPSTYNVSWQAVPGAIPNTDSNYEAIRDMRTITKACEQILLSLKNAGMDVNVRSQFVIVAPIQLMSRITRALGVLNQGISGQFPGVLFNVRVVWTMMLSASDKYYVVLPKRKLKAGIREDLTMYADFDIMTRSNVVAGYMRYGGAIGEIKQIARCSIA